MLGWPNPSLFLSSHLSHTCQPPLLNLNKAMSLEMMIIGGFLTSGDDFDDGWNMMMRALLSKATLTAGTK